jgi:hypothetical protein
MADPDLAKLVRLGENPSKGADGRKKALAARRVTDRERFSKLALDYRNNRLLRGEAPGNLSGAVDYIREIERERLKPRKPPSASYVWERLAEEGLTGETYETFHRGEPSP